ncbi:MAG: hypothetical protein V4690_01310 [Patescibacteria group bacterium]
MSNLPELVGSKPKFLLGKEKVWRWIVGGAYAAGIVGIGTFVLPYIINFATLGIEAGYKLLVLGGMLAIIGTIGAFVMNPKVQAAAWYLFMGWVDAFALKIAQVDPVTRSRSYVTHYLEPKGAKNQEVLDRAVGREKSAQRRLEETQTSLAEAKRRAEYCVEHGSSDGGRKWTDSKLQTEFRVLSQKIRSLTGAVAKLEKRLLVQKGYVALLTQLQGVITSIIEVTRFNVEMMVQDYESAEDLAQGADDLKGILGKDEKTKLFEMTAQSMMQQTDQWIAEAEGVMNTVRGQLVAGQIDDAIGEEDLIRELTGRVDSMSTFAEGQRQLAENRDPVLLIEARSRVGEEVPVARKVSQTSEPTDRFGSLLPPR